MASKPQIRHIVIGNDANYLHKAVIYYQSLEKVWKNFKVHAFCFDDVTYQAYKKLNFKHLIPYRAEDFETKELLKLKASKERLYEYYWACNAFITRKVMQEQKADSVTFSDCDYMFFSSPEPIFDEFKGADVIIQPNNYSYQSIKDVGPIGYYCSSWESFRNNKNGLKVLNYWHGKCMGWCSSKIENGKFGDQKYLDVWRTSFPNVREVANAGANVAPWNMQKYDFSVKNGQVMLNNKWPLIYYHYHSFRMNLDKYDYVLTGDRHNNYEISNNAVNIIYKPYITAMKKALKLLKTVPEYRAYVKENICGNYHVNK